MRNVSHLTTSKLRILPYKSRSLMDNKVTKSFARGACIRSVLQVSILMRTAFNRSVYQIIGLSHRDLLANPRHL